MPRPTHDGQQYDEASYRRSAAWPAILLASPVGLLIAMIVFSEIRENAPPVADAGATAMSSVFQPPARPEPVIVPAAVGGPALATTRPEQERVRAVRTVPAAQLQTLLSDPAIRDFKGLSENDWDFNKPADIPGFGAYPGAEQAGVPYELKLTGDQ